MPFSEKDKHFLSFASTDVIIPQNTRLSLSEVLKTNEEGLSIHNIKQRDFLFFDECLTVYVVLRVAECPEDELKSYLARLDLKVEAWVSNDSQANERTPSGTGTVRELLCTKTVQHTDDPIVLISQNEGDSKIFLNLIWEVAIVLSRPRARFQTAYSNFVPIALISPADHTGSQDVYLEPFKPQLGNLFEALSGSRGYEKDAPYLPISRLDTILPPSPKDDTNLRLQHTPSQPLPIHLALVTRLRCSKAVLDDAIVSMVASLDIEIIPFINVRGRIEGCDARLQKGTTHELMDDVLPMDCYSRDCITILYRLEQATRVHDHSRSIDSAHIDVLSITTKLKLLLADTCQPEIQTQFSTNIDFARSLSQTPIPIGLPIHTPSQSISSQSPSQSNGRNVVTISFSAVDAQVQVGVPFLWKVLVVNGSLNAAKLAIIPLPRLPKPTSQIQQYAKRHATRSSVASQSSEKIVGDRAHTDIAQAVIDENIIYAMQHSGAVPPETDLMSLTPELRVGPLAPGQCHEGEIRFVAFKAGAFTLDAIRVVDLVKEVEQGYGSAGVVMDIRELPDVIVV